MRYELTIQPASGQYIGCSAESLLEHLQLTAKHDFVQVWVYLESGQNMGIHANQNYALAIWYDGEGDGAEAYNPEYVGQNEPQKIYLENGEGDTFPKSDCLVKSDAIEGILEFCRTGMKV